MAGPTTGGAWRRQRARRRGIWLLAAHVAAALLHLLLFLVVLQLPDTAQLSLLPIRYHTPPAIPAALRPERPELPKGEMKRIVIDHRLPALPRSASRLPDLPPLEASIVALTLGRSTAEGLGARREAFEAMADSLPTLEEIELAGVARGAEQMRAYRRLRLPDADTSDLESADRKRARQIVQRAIDAMGGAQALANLRQMSLAPAQTPAMFDEWESVRTGVRTETEMRERLDLRRTWFRRTAFHQQYAQTLPGGGRLVWDGRAAFIAVGEAVVPVIGDSVTVIRNRAERWDFLSRFVGDGVEVSYLASPRGVDRNRYDVIRVDDRRFGGLLFRAWFDRDSGLLVAEEFPVDDPLLRRRFGEYRAEGDALLWHVIETEYVGGGRDSLLVSYGEVPDSVFSRGTRREALVLQGHEESPATLWVDVAWRGTGYSGSPVVSREGLGLVSEKGTRDYRRRSLRDSSKYYLTYEQRDLVSQQLRAGAVRGFRARGLFSRVESLPEGFDVPAGDYLLRLTPLPKKTPQEVRGRVFYGAEVFEVTDARRRIVADGPLPDFYFGVVWGGMIPYNDNRFRLRKDCGVYRMTVHAVGESAAYVSAAKLVDMLERTYVKLSQALRAETVGEPHTYANRCCYCSPP